MDDASRPARAHPWWQQRRSTVRRTTALAVLAVVLAVALLAAAVSQVVEGRSPWSFLAATFWVPFAAAAVAGAVAQRREERAGR